MTQLHVNIELAKMGIPIWAHDPLDMASSDDATTHGLVHKLADVQLIRVGVEDWSDAEIGHEIIESLLGVAPEWLQQAILAICTPEWDPLRDPVDPWYHREVMRGISRFLFETLNTRLGGNEGDSEDMVPGSPIAEWSATREMPTWIKWPEDAEEKLIWQGIPDEWDEYEPGLRDACKNWYTLYHFLVDAELTQRLMEANDRETAGIIGEDMPPWSRKVARLYYAQDSVWKRHKVLAYNLGGIRKICEGGESGGKHGRTTIVDAASDKIPC